MQKKMQNYSQQNAQNETMLQYTRWPPWPIYLQYLSGERDVRTTKSFVSFFTGNRQYSEGTHLEKNAIIDVFFLPSGCLR